MNGTLQELWGTVISEVKKEIADESLELWFRPLKPISLENGIFTLQCPNKFFSDWIGQNYQKKIEEIAEKWSPYRTYACRLFWNYSDLDKLTSQKQTKSQ